jgi:hypothetical protein
VDEMKILKIDWLSKEIDEAILTLCSEKNYFQAFCHPCHYKVGEEINKPIYSLDDEDIMRVEAQETNIKQLGDSFEHEIIAKVEDIKTKLVSVDNIKIKLSGYLPGDILEEDFISFKSNRLDVHE